MTEENQTMLVRLKPFDPRKGFKLRRYTVFGIRFEAGTGWSEVDVEVANYLRTVRADERNEASPLAFDVLTREEALDMEDAEKRKREEAEQRASAPRIVRREAAPGVLTTRDLPQPSVLPEPVDLPMARTVDTQPGPQPDGRAPGTTRSRVRRPSP